MEDLFNMKDLLNEDQQIEAGRKMVAAAFDALGEYVPDSSNDNDDRLVINKILKALVAAKKKQKEIYAEYIAIKTKKTYFSIDTTPEEATATAYSLWADGDPVINVSECFGYTIAANRLLRFASAMAASKMAECALNLLDTDCFGMLNYCDEGAELLSNCNGEEHA